MSRFKVANAVRALLVGIANWFYGCPHRKTTFPITLCSGSSGDKEGAQAETYIVCLECGRHFAYDWIAMRRTRTAWVRRQPALGWK